jgi:tetratricopeptide (TPR) repeat protein
MQNPYGRVELLLSQRRYELAERELRGMLAAEPRDATAHALLSLCVLQDRTRLADATEAAQQAVGLAPDEPFAHYALSLSYLYRGYHHEAETAAREALRLDPHNADAFAVLAHAALGRERYEDALQSATAGLAIDPDHLECANLRSIALERLGRNQEAVAAAAATLRRDPDDPMSHAAYGLTLLNSGRYQEAQIAFRESLRLDPGNELARNGLIQSLHNRSFLFRLVHRFYVAMSRLNSKAAFGLIIGAWLLMQVLSRVAGQWPALQPLILPILVCYVLFVVLTWIANPLFNTFLRFHPFGQHLLDRQQRWASNLIAPCLALSLFGMVSGLTLYGIGSGIIAAAYWLGMAIPIAAAFAMPTPQRRLWVGAAAIVVLLLPVVGLLRGVGQESLTPFFVSLQYFGYSLLGIQIASGIIAAQSVKVA